MGACWLVLTTRKILEYALDNPIERIQRLNRSKRTNKLIVFSYLLTCTKQPNRPLQSPKPF